MGILNPAELLQAQEIINKTSKGVYVLKDIYGPVAWAGVVPTTFGNRFKETVETGLLNRIELRLKKTDNHQRYEIFNLPIDL